jgi:hypothetical protein
MRFQENSANQHFGLEDGKSWDSDDDDDDDDEYYYYDDVEGTSSGDYEPDPPELYPHDLNQTITKWQEEAEEINRLNRTRTTTQSSTDITIDEEPGSNDTPNGRGGGGRGRVASGAGRNSVSAALEASAFAAILLRFTPSWS